MQVCLVTGGNSGVGLMTAVGLAKLGNHVFIACRSATKAAKAIEYIRRTTLNQNVEFLPLDLASLDSVRNCVTLFNEKNLPLHILVNNAGIFNRRGTTKEGFELIWGTNYLGHFLLTYLLLEKMQKSAPSRIIMVSSDLALYPSGIDWDLLVKRTPLNFINLYAISKLCLLLLTQELSQRLNNSQVTVNAIHPGFVQSNITIWHQLSKYLGLGISPEAGAYSTLVCAISPDYQSISGKFLDRHNKEIPLPKIAQDKEILQELWERSLLWTGCNQQQNLPKINYDGTDGIWGPISLNLNSKELSDITKNILNEVLPKLPKRVMLTQLFLALIKFNPGSVWMIIVQLLKKSFHMERHLDSPIILNLCHNKSLLEKLSEHLGENLVLWRSEVWVNYPAQQLIPFWHQDSYPKLLKGDGKTIHAYIALTEVNEHNGFEYIPNSYLKNFPIKLTDPFSGNQFFDIPDEVVKKAIPVVLRPGEFVLFTDNLVHRSIRNQSGKVRLSLTLRLTQPGVEILPRYTSNYHKPLILQSQNKR
ncbi:SDR family NAD(P)-dependent oxidoreductase [Aetokthonos hydrillicola Thurmond2011]|jgi:NAD(P)-dependent dehydrogenase (short-subunit alcohol dehydrogenase family)|uniref:SDR family NAD(P)-dependent oxidoreductase n=1 Tax=Aetokthonos hydrillicola Thurmond2011 TaxID=2712845 RepID=A0AAP5I533_9CYAN|nr:SDR family NAD(P)-dependent oxidoreductase [Aetokthonos hydrillicola]MBO3461510.1 SDR family NAD(P)-dependent oxidoreductase [Aetokthonos hydrillicola CCALA 1050]MBW4584649.1 SDR family NAD(P)-dependent oxidoreductase [Aetokthonos hydrillicola CCALA 1050]MDR9895193.1 SDR family NAD(P)-dependent oxidoreductase [Aetokthonos hydrillicola Thurmond2011]